MLLSLPVSATWEFPIARPEPTNTIKDKLLRLGFGVCVGDPWFLRDPHRLLHALFLGLLYEIIKALMLGPGSRAQRVVLQSYECASLVVRRLLTCLWFCLWLVTM